MINRLLFWGSSPPEADKSAFDSQATFRLHFLNEEQGQAYYELRVASYELRVEI